MKHLKNASCLLILLLSLVSCKEEVKKKTYIRSVRVIEASLNTEQNNNTVVPASIHEKRETKLAFRVKGPLVQLNDTIGDYLAKGDVIAKIDPRDYKIALEATQASYKLASAEYERYKILLEQESVAESTFDQIESNYTSAKTAYESAKNALKDTDLRAPFSGYINNTFVNNYEEVNPGQAIVSLIDLSKFEVKAWLSLEDLAKVKDDTRFNCLIELAGEKLRLPGSLKEIGHKTSSSKQSYPISILIDVPEKVKLRAGATAHLEICENNSNSNSFMQVPISCVFSKNNKTFVWIYNEKTSMVSAKEVRKGQILSDHMIRIEKGLKGGEFIVKTGVNFLTEGQKVKKLEAFSKSNIGNKL